MLGRSLWHSRLSHRSPTDLAFLGLRTGLIASARQRLTFDRRCCMRFELDRLLAQLWESRLIHPNALYFATSEEDREGPCTLLVGPLPEITSRGIAGLAKLVGGEFKECGVVVSYRGGHSPGSRVIRESRWRTWTSSGSVQGLVISLL